MDKRRRWEKSDIARVPAWPVFMDEPRLSRHRADPRKTTATLAAMKTTRCLSIQPRPARPFDLRKLGSNGLPEGTSDDCDEGSGWELRGNELVRLEAANYNKSKWRSRCGG